MKVSAVLFDVGNTLLHLDYARIAPAVSAAAGVPLTARQLVAAAPVAARALEDASGNDRGRARRYLELLFGTAGVPHDRLEPVGRVLAAMHAERGLWSGVAPDTIGALERLRAAGLPLGVVSNSDGGAEAALREAGLRSLFAVVIDSALVGVEKPDPRIFAPALAALGVAPGDVLYVGDTYAVDVVGARRAGLQAALLEPADTGAPLRPDVWTVPSLGQLVDELLAA
ncbi:MAG: HAD-IA family hydrolase [Gemmatimonadales bacterium]